VRALLKPFGSSRRFVALINDGVSTLFPALEATTPRRFLADGVASICHDSRRAAVSPTLSEGRSSWALPAVRRTRTPKRCASYARKKSNARRRGDD